MTGIWFNGKWAPEVISNKGEDYLAGYGRGLWVARLKWVEMTSSQAKAHASPILEKVRAGRAAASGCGVRQAAGGASRRPGLDGTLSMIPR